MTHHDCLTEHTCSQMISFDLDGEVVRNIYYEGGCEGNLKAVPLLVDGWTVGEIEGKLKGIQCGRRGTSCADQLARAVRKAYDEEREVNDTIEYGSKA